MQNYIARFRLLKPRNDPQDCSLAAPGSAEQNQGFALSHIESYVFKHARFLESLADAAHTGGYACPMLALRSPGYMQLFTDRR